jgi:hypothetical protein
VRNLLLKLGRRITVGSGSTVSLVVQIYDTRSETFAIQRQRFVTSDPSQARHAISLTVRPAIDRSGTEETSELTQLKHTGNFSTTYHNSFLVTGGA